MNVPRDSVVSWPRGTRTPGVVLASTDEQIALREICLDAGREEHLALGVADDGLMGSQ